MFHLNRFSSTKSGLFKSSVRPSSSTRSTTPSGAGLTSFNKGTFQWVKGELLGKGSYARVYLGLNANTGEIMAVKQVELPRTPSDQLSSRHHDITEALKFERNTLMGLDHPNIVQYLGYEESPEYLSIFLEYVPGGTISSCLYNHGSFSEEVTKSFTHQVLKGLDYLHCMRILHRDLKSENILVEPSGICKISDFGISKQVEDMQDVRAFTGMKGTIFWMAPEMLDNDKNKGYDAKVDIWSVGCIVLEMWTGERPWYGEEIYPVMLNLSQHKQPPPLPTGYVLTEDASDFRNQCFQGKPENRPPAGVLLEHPYLKLPPTWIFDSSEIAPLRRSISVTSRRSRRRAPSMPATSESVPPVPPVSTPINATYRPSGNPTLTFKAEPRLNSNSHHKKMDPSIQDDGPRLVIITPPSSPRLRTAQLPNNSSKTSLDTAGSISVETKVKGYHLVNPDSEENESKPYNYIPPPLPGINGSAYYSSSLQPSMVHGVLEVYPMGYSEKRETSSQPLLSPNGISQKLAFNQSRRTHSYTELTNYSCYYANHEIWAMPPSDKTGPSRNGRPDSPTSSEASTHEEWARPNPAAVYENLQQFFPEDILDKPIIDIHPTTGEKGRDRGRRAKISIRMVAEGQKSSAPRRGTKLWDSNVEELRA